MVDITVVGTALSSIKTAFEIAKLLREAGQTVEAAEWKLRLAELMESLADARMKIVEIQDVVQDRDQKIKELETALVKHGDLVRHRDAYYIKNDEGNPSGAPMCMKCWEVNHKLVSLYRSGTKASPSGSSHEKNQCPQCGTAYSIDRSKDL